MRKSSSIRLVLLGTASAAALSACGDSNAPPKDARYFASQQECSAVYGDQPCRDAKSAAEQAHVTQAPRYYRKDECEAEYGAGHCETREIGGSSYVMPLLAGYMIGNMLSGPRYAQPVYRDRNDNAVAPGSGGGGGGYYRVGSYSGGGVSGSSAGARPVFRPAAQVSSISRGGFGSTAMRFSGSSGG